MNYPKKYEAIVVGAGHAGCEAALALARRGHATLLLTMSLDQVALMPCNPAIGGVGKGQLVREIDALGGEMGNVIDQTGIQFRTLNLRKGPAVHSTRAQADKYKYKMLMKSILENQTNLDLKQGTVSEILNRQNAQGELEVCGVVTKEGWTFSCQALVLTTGTFLNGLLHIGDEKMPGGRMGAGASLHLSESLQKMGLKIGRLKTGTVPRVNAKTIDWQGLEEQNGDNPRPRFSFRNHPNDWPQISCYLTYTNENTHEIIRKNIHRSPLYRGIIQGIGPRYCPSIEDKVVRFAEKIRHQVFLEPEGLDTQEVYLNGLSTSLPVDVQLEFLRSIVGLEKVEVMRAGYAVEYDYLDPRQLKPSLETKFISGLFFAGQVNGSSGYEEAAAQGLMAGINVSCKIRCEEPFILARDEAYIGVLIDDLITQGAPEPYRMFTSRAEHRLLLREDNADFRLRPKGRQLGLVHDADWLDFEKKMGFFDKLEDFLDKNSLLPSEKAEQFLADRGMGPLKQKTRLKQLLQRPNLALLDLLHLHGTAPQQISPSTNENLIQECLKVVEVQAKYSGYIQAQEEQVVRFRDRENSIIPEYFDFGGISGLSREVQEKLLAVRPRSLGQAERIPGMTPAAIGLIMVHLKRIDRGHVSRET